MGRRFFACSWCVCLLVVGVARADNTTQDGLPYVFGDYSIAQQIMHGNANMMVVGDSIATDIAPSYLTEWHPDQWSGLVIGSNFPNEQFTLSESSVSSQEDRTPLSAVGPSGLTTTVPGQQREVVFNGTAAPATDSSPQALADRFFELGFAPGVDGTAVTSIANQAIGSVTMTPLIYANSNGVADNTVSMSVRIGYNVVGTLQLNGNNTSTPTLIGSSITIPNQVWTDGNYLTADFRVNAGAAPASGSNLTIAGIRISNGGNGFQLANTALGGWNVEDYLNTSITPLATVQQYVTLTNSNIAFIALGTNDLGPDSAATFKTNMQALINMYRSINPNMEFVLLANYDENQTEETENGVLKQQLFAQDMYQLAQENTGVLFMDLYDKADNYSVLQANYLSPDGLHPDAAGETYFADQEWDLIREAAALAPEPTAMSVLLAVGGAAMLRRRRRRERVS